MSNFMFAMAVMAVIMIVVLLSALSHYCSKVSNWSESIGLFIGSGIHIFSQMLFLMEISWSWVLWIGIILSPIQFFTSFMGKELPLAKLIGASAYGYLIWFYYYMLTVGV